MLPISNQLMDLPTECKDAGKPPLALRTARARARVALRRAFC